MSYSAQLDNTDLVKVRSIFTKAKHQLDDMSSKTTPSQLNTRIHQAPHHGSRQDQLHITEEQGELEDTLLTPTETAHLC